MKTKAAIFCISKILFLSMVFFKETSSDKTFLLHISKANNSWKAYSAKSKKLWKNLWNGEKFAMDFVICDSKYMFPTSNVFFHFLQENAVD